MSDSDSDKPLPQWFDFQKQPPFCDRTIRFEDHIIKAHQLRGECARNLERNPVFEEMRRTHDAAQRIDGDGDGDRTAAAASSSKSPFIGASAAAAAMRDLRSNLSSLRSNRHSCFQESVPPSGDETRFRASLASDCIADELRDAPVKTAVTVNARPLNPAAFQARRQQILGNAGINVDFNGEKAHLIVRGRARLKDGLSPSDVKGLVDIISLLLPREGELAATDGKPVSPDGSVKVSEDGKFIEVTFALRDDERDPVEKLLNKMVREMTDLARRDEAPMAAESAAPDCVRLGTFTFQSPHALGDFIASDHKTYIKLFEASRLAFEVITRQRKAIPLLLGAELANATLTDDMDITKEVAGMCSMASMPKDVSVNIKMSPAELSFAETVRTAGQILRRVVGLDTDRGMRGSEAGHVDAFARKVLGSGMEDLIASSVGSAAFLGATSSLARAHLQRLAALPIVVANTEREDVLSELPEVQQREEMMMFCVGILFERARNCVASFKTGTLISHGIEVKAELQGFDEANLWSWIPKTMQGMVDAAKVPGVAFSDEDDVFSFDSLLIDDMCEPRLYVGHRRSILRERIERIVESLWMGQSEDQPRMNVASVLQNPQGTRNTAFTILVEHNRDDDKDESWAQLLSLFGVECLNLPSEKMRLRNERIASRGARGESDDDDDDDDDEENEMVPPPDEGNYRDAWVRDAKTGRLLHFVRLVPDHCGVVVGAWTSYADAIINIGKIEDNPLGDALGDSDAGGRRGRTRYGFNVDLVANRLPVLMVSTSPSLAATPKNLGEFKTARFSVTALRYADLPQGGNARQAEAAAEWLEWLVANSTEQSKARGLAGATPASAFDWPVTGAESMLP